MNPLDKKPHHTSRPASKPPPGRRSSERPATGTRASSNPAPALVAQGEDETEAAGKNEPCFQDDGAGAIEPDAFTPYERD